jgi:uncharacterized damage-inducible protein DinB
MTQDVTAADLRYPIGRYLPPAQITAADRAGWIEELVALPAKMREAVSGLDDRQLDTPYRPGGWTLRQVVHHVPDSHVNSYVRFRLALTEDIPTIKPYNEATWAELPDAKSAPIEPSLQLLEALHVRWVALLKSLSDAEFKRTFRHPEHGEIPIDWTLGLYAWHSRHHVAQITGLRDRERW